MPYANICVCFVFPVSCQDASSTRIAKRASSVGVGKLAKRRISKRPAACAETERADLHKEIHPVWKKGPQNWTAWNWNSCPNSWIGVDRARATQHDNGGQGRPECSRFYRGGKSICEVAVHKRKLLLSARDGMLCQRDIFWRTGLGWCWVRGVSLLWVEAPPPTAARKETKMY